VRSDGAPQFFTAAELARWEAAGKPGFGAGAGIDESEPAGEIAWGWESLGVHSAAQIPTDPAALAQLVARNATGTKKPARLGGVPGHLRRPALRSALGAQTAAFYEVLASLPGIQLVGRSRDALGRPGYGVRGRARRPAAQRAHPRTPRPGACSAAG